MKTFLILVLSYISSLSFATTTTQQKDQRMLVCTVSEGEVTEEISIDNANQDIVETSKNWGPWKVSIELVIDYGAALVVSAVNSKYSSGDKDFEKIIYLTNEVYKPIYESSDFKINHVLTRDPKVTLSCDTELYK